jgi:hypothetical protein
VRFPSEIGMGDESSCMGSLDIGNLRRARRGRHQWAATLAGAGAAAAVLFGILHNPATQVPHDPEASRPLERLAGYDVTPRPLQWLPPAAVVDAGPPDGWSHLVLTLHFEVGSGDADKFPRAAAEAVAALSSVFAANVQVQAGEVPGRYRLAGLGIGLAAGIDGRQTIVSGASRELLDAHLNRIARRALQEHEKHANAIRIKARSDTFAVYDNPTHLFRDGGHHPMVLRFGLLVDPRTGRLDTLVWRLDGSAAEGYTGPVGPAEWLSSGMTHRFLLHADAREFTLGLPMKETVLALPSLPPGRRQVAFPVGLRELAGLPAFTSEQAAGLERGLRDVLAE